jgi:uncharacterized cupin superfamily protein
MPKIDLGKILADTGTTYPAPFRKIVAGRRKRKLGNIVGLTQFGVNLVELKPGAASALRHWHEQEDEFVYVIEGELTLVENEGETLLRRGDAAGFKAGVANGHHLVNRSQRDGAFLVVGTRASQDRAHYPDNDLAYEYDGTSFIFKNKAGEPYGS